MVDAAGTGADSERRDREFLALLGKHELDLAACVHALVPCWQDAEDILQETKITLWQEFGKYRPGSDFRAWARTIARYAVRTYVQQSRRRPVVLSGEVGDLLMENFAKTAPRPNERLELLVECLKKLGQDALDLLRRCYVDRQKIKDIAAELGRSLSGTYSAISRARRELLDCMKKSLRRDGDPSDFRASEGDCPNFRASENGTVPFNPRRDAP